MSLPPPPPPDPRAPFVSGTAAGSSKKSTLPPPEWVEREGPRSAASLALERHERDVAVARRTGPRAELCQLRSRLELARASGDADAERTAATALARALAARGSELDTATRLARRALVLGEDAALREELSGWFAGLGEPALAAATLRVLLEEQSGDQSVRTLMRVAVLLSRASDAEGAIEALEQAAQEKATDPVPLELIGMIGGWAPSALRTEYVARAYLAAAQRHEARGERADAFEDLLRAFEMAPTSEDAAERLSAALVTRGRAGAADEVNREHARALGEAGRAVHVRRMRYAVRESDLARALGAGLDARLEAELEIEPVLAELEAGRPEHADTTSFDELITRVGLHELVAARLEIACDELGGKARARARLALGRLYVGPLSSPDRAAEAWIDALVSDPANEEAKSSLRAHAASTRDQTPIVDALIRMGLSEDSTTLSDRMACLRELIVLAEQRLSDPGLALWAVERVLAGTGSDEDIRRTAARLAQRARLQDESLAAARAALETAAGSERVELLRRAAVILRGRPDDVDAYVAVLGELVTLAPDERGWQHALERVLYREARLSELEAALTSFVLRSETGMEIERGRIALSAVKRRRGDLPGALRELTPLLTDVGAHPAAWSHALVLSARLGDDLTRALALRRIAGPLPAPLRAIVSSVAAEALLSVGQIERARDAAEQACRADPSLARPTAARAAISMSFPDQGAAAALERATGVVLPRAELCHALSDSCVRLGDPVLAVAWTQRRLALKPGDPGALRALLQTIIETGDATRIGDSLGWLLAQPLPLGDFVEPLGAALRRLADLEPSRAAALARRALDVLGPRQQELRELVLSVADRVGERGLGIAVVERWLAIGATGIGRAELALELARRRKAAGDADGAARALQRALQDGADAAKVLAELDSALPAKDSDGEIALLEARAGALAALENADPRGVARAFRELGAARWDLAADTQGAVEAWLRAASFDKESGILRLSRDLVAFAGYDEALRRLGELSLAQTERPVAAEMLAAAAGVALQGGRNSQALGLAARALELDPSRGDVLAIAERTAGPADLAELEEIYDKLGTAALGCYGERAVHYRAARQFERRAEPERALGQALRAFEAVPGEGVTFVLITRLAERVGDASSVVRVLERVASRSSDANARARWLRQAALFAGTSDAGKLERVEVLLRAFSVQPDAETLSALGVALAELVSLYPDERETMQLRFEHAVEGLFHQSDGPEGARLAIRAAELALSIFAASKVALAALERAVKFDGDVDEFAALLAAVPRLAKEPVAARSFVEQVSSACSDPHRMAGRHALELAAALAEALDDSPLAARLLVHAARAAPEDRDLVRRADAAARTFGDAELMTLLLDAVPAKERLSSLLALAQHAEREGNLPAAAEALEQVLAGGGMELGDRQNTFLHLREIYIRSGRRDALEQLLNEEIARSGEDGDRVLLLSRDLAALVATRGDPDRALRILDAMQARFPEHEGLLGDVVEFARQAGDRRRRADALGGLANSVSEPQARLLSLRELALLLEELGERVAAYARWSEVLSLDPNDVAAIAALEREAEHRGDYERLVELLTRRASLASMVDDVRRIHLHRAMVLEQRLGRPDEARNELEAVLAATGDNMAVLRVLADLDERLGAPLRAGPLWMRASAVSRDRDEAADLARRACEAYLAGGDVDSARRVLDGMEAWARSHKVLELRVQIERRTEKPLALAEALEELAIASLEPPEKRAALLVESARASLSGGDPQAALLRAQRAARIAPQAVEAQLCARWLEYLERGPGAPDEARITLAELRGIEAELTPQQGELCAFLVAEAADVALGHGAGLRDLAQAHERIGPRPLVALAIAERLAVAGDPAQALAMFEVALAGDLERVRTRGRVALSAAQAARRQRELERALGYLEIAANDPASRAEALGLQADLRTELRPDDEVDRRVENARVESEPPLAPTEEEPDSDSPLKLVERSSRPAPDKDPESAPPAAPSARPRAVSRLSSRPPVSSARKAIMPPPSVGRTPAASPAAASAPSAGRQPAAPPASSGRQPAAPPASSGRQPAAAPASAGRQVVASPASGREPAAPVVPPVPRPPPPSGRMPAAPPVPGPAAPPPASSGRMAAAPTTERMRPPQPSAVLPLVPVPYTEPTTARFPSAPPVALAAAPAASPEPPRAPLAPLPRVIEVGAGPKGSVGVSQTVSVLSAAERSLLAALDKGSVEAGKELILQLENRPDRARDLLSVCRRMAVLLPGEPWTLERLYQAALADRHMVYARALEHVRAAFQPNAKPADPPPLADQPEQPEWVRALLFRTAGSPAPEALSLVWEGGAHIFRRDPSTYGITSMERVPSGSQTPVGRVYSAAARLLGLIRTPLYQRRSSGAVTLSVALISPPALVLSGEVRQETPELRFHIGAMLAAAMSQFVLMFGAPESQARAVLKGLGLAFGTSQPDQGSVSNVANLAEVLWESVPARSQRRLRELCYNPRVLEYDAVMTEARMAIRRAGLFVSGDLRVAVRETCADESISVQVLSEPNGLAALCASSPGVSDLVRLATSPEYAEARWQPSRSGTRHPGGGFATFSAR